MERAVNFKSPLKRRKSPIESPEDRIKSQILEDMKDLIQRVSIANAQFEYEKDPDLIDANIYELESLKARYRYLYKKARELGVSCKKIEIGFYVEREEDIMG